MSSNQGGECDRKTLGDYVRRDAPIHGFVVCYALVGLALSVTAGVPHKFVPLAYVGVLPLVTLLVSVFTVVVVLALVLGSRLRSMVSGKPFAGLRRAPKRAVSPRLLAALLLFFSLCLFMGVFSSIKTVLPDLVPFFADPWLADVDRLLHGKAPWRYSVSLLPPALTGALERLYFGGWAILLLGTILAVLLVPRLAAVRSQYLWTMLVMWPLLGNIIAAATMSAGPVYFELVTGSARFAGLVDYLERYSIAQPWGQAYLWNSYVSGEAGAGSGISAFPSMHIANATLFALLARRVHRWLFWIASAFCAVILVGSVHLGWHYAIDGYFSIAATVLIWKTVGRVLERQRRRTTAWLNTKPAG